MSVQSMPYLRKTCVLCLRCGVVGGLVFPIPNSRAVQSFIRLSFHATSWPYGILISCNRYDVLPIRFLNIIPCASQRSLVQSLSSIQYYNFVCYYRTSKTSPRSHIYSGPPFRGGRLNIPMNIRIGYIMIFDLH